MFTLTEARRIGTRWANQGRLDDPWEIGVREFDGGYLVWPVPPPGSQEGVGAGRAIIDRETGELSVWPALPLDAVIAMYQDERARQLPVPRTWDPAAQARRDLTREQFPAHVTHLTLGSGRRFVCRSMKGDGEPNYHPLVAEFLDAVPVDARERGYRRCSEVAAISDALHAEDAGRAADHRPPITLDQARDDLLAGADLVTYRIREPDDPLAGLPGPPCLSCYLLLDRFGFTLQAPGGGE